MKCPNPKCQFSGLESLEETANFCPRCGWNLGQSEEASSALNEKDTTVSKNPTRNASKSEDRRFDPQDSTGKSFHELKLKILLKKFFNFYARSRRTHQLSLSVGPYFLVLSL